MKKELSRHRETFAIKDETDLDKEFDIDKSKMKRRKDVIAHSGRLTDLIRNQKRLSEYAMQNPFKNAIDPHNASKSIQDKFTDPMLNIQKAAESSYEYRSNIHRALNSMYVGYDSVEVLDRLSSAPGGNRSRSSSREGFNSSGQANNLVVQQREARDKLLYNQLSSGIIPENLLKSGKGFDNLITLDLSHYGLGDEMGLCLGKR